MPTILTQRATDSSSKAFPTGGWTSNPEYELMEIDYTLTAEMVDLDVLLLETNFPSDIEFIPEESKIQTVVAMGGTSLASIGHGTYDGTTYTVVDANSLMVSVDIDAVGPAIDFVHSTTLPAGVATRVKVPKVVQNTQLPWAVALTLDSAVTQPPIGGRIKVFLAYRKLA